jgi:flagellar L-ring protein FlgH
MRTVFFSFLVIAGVTMSNGVLAQEVDQQYPQQTGQAQVQPFWAREKKPPLAPVLPLPAASTARSSGPRESLYSEVTYQSFTSDRRLHKLGDLVTVLIIEDASATSTADTGANRDAAVGVSIRNPAISKSFGVGTNNDFTGGGRTQRAGRLLAQLTVTVRDVLGNGDLMVGGEQVLEINGERQVIRLEGRVRTRDVSELNTVPSSRVADAKISFAGDGVLGERQQPGWWHQILTFFGF